MLLPKKYACVITGMLIANFTIVEPNTSATYILNQHLQLVTSSSLKWVKIMINIAVIYKFLSTDFRFSNIIRIGAKSYRNIFSVERRKRKSTFVLSPGRA